MRHFVIVAMFFFGCGSSPAPADLSTVAESDFATPNDFAVPPLPPDLAFSLCTSPQSGIYFEQVQYNYVPAGGGTAMFSASQTVVTVKNDGSYVRPSTMFATPTLYHCSFTAVDPITCMAACCPGQTASPTMYFDKGGWTLWSGGACAFQTTTAAQYIANITDVEGYFSR